MFSVREREVWVLFLCDLSLNKMRLSFEMQCLCMITSVGLSQQIRIFMPNDQCGMQYILYAFGGRFALQINLRVFNFERGGSERQFAGLVSFPVLRRRKRPDHQIGLESITL